MKLTVLPTLLLLLVFMGGCKKDNTGKKNNTTTAFIKTIIQERDSLGVRDTITYFYDNQNRITSFVSSFQGTTTFTYSGNTIFQRKISATDSLSYTYYLNSKGLADSEVYVSPSGLITYYKNTYDDNNFLVKTIIYQTSGPYGEVVDYIIINDNLTDVKPDAGSVTWFNYTYNTSYKNTIGNYNMGQIFLGSSSVNLPISIAIQQSGWPSSISYQYTFDSYGRVKTSTSDYDGAISYTYY